MMIILQYVRDAMHFDPWQGPGEKSFAFFVVSMALTLPASHLGLSDLNQREEQDETVFEDDLGDAGAGFVAMTTPASAGEYCPLVVTVEIFAPPGVPTTPSGVTVVAQSCGLGVRASLQATK